MNASILDMLLMTLAGMGGAGAVVVALTAWLGRIWEKRLSHLQEFGSHIDQGLRDKRIEVYIPLWTATSLLPKWARTEEVTYERLREFSRELRDWYFKVGGIYLSRAAFDEGYRPLQEQIAEVLGTGKSGPLDDAHYDLVRDRCSDLRHRLTDDLESRRNSPL